MFNNNGPISAHNAMRAYVVNNGLAAFPAEVRDHMAALNNMITYDAMSDGIERLYAALLEVEGMPNRPDGLMALGEAAQASAIAQTDSKGTHWWAIRNWAAYEINPVGEAPPVPEVKEGFSYTPAEAPPAPPVPAA